MAVIGDVIAKAIPGGYFTAHELSDVTDVDPAGLYSSPSKLIRAGEFMENSYRESDGYFFPLGSDANGFIPADTWDAPSLTATLVSNFTYDECGAFVGPATINLWPDKTTLHGFEGDGTISKIYSTPAGINKGVELLKTSPGDEFNSLAVSNVASYPGIGSYTLSAYVRQSEGEIASEIPSRFEVASGVGGTPITNTLIRKYPANDKISDQWHRIIRSANYTGASTNMAPFIEWSDNTSTDAAYRLYGMQLEKLAFPTPYTASSRSAGLLGFNLNSLIGLDWSADWSIMYWKKPVGTDNGIIGYSVESLGRNGNTVGGGYAWFGKPSGSNTVTLGGATLISGDNTFSWDDYQYRDQLVVIKYNAISNKLSYLIYGLNDDPIIFEKTLDITTADYFVTQDGIDFQLGGFDLTHQPAAHYRDLVIYKRELSEEYTTKYYKTTLKIFSGLEIYSSIIREEDL